MTIRDYFRLYLLPVPTGTQSSIWCSNLFHSPKEHYKNPHSVVHPQQWSSALSQHLWLGSGLLHIHHGNCCLWGNVDFWGSCSQTPECPLLVAQTPHTGCKTSMVKNMTHICYQNECSIFLVDMWLNSYQIGSRVWTDLCNQRVGTGPSTSLNITSGTGAAMKRVRQPEKITFTEQIHQYTSQSMQVINGCSWSWWSALDLDPWSKCDFTAAKQQEHLINNQMRMPQAMVWVTLDGGVGCDVDGGAG